MYPVDERDKVVALESVSQSSVGAPLPIVLSDEHKILLAYVVEDTAPDWDGSSVRVVDPSASGEPLALVEFSSYSSLMFGAPNDEAFAGHPLTNRGLHSYAAFQIENSSWIRQLMQMNSVHHYHKPERFERLKHFVFAFHDSTFECVAERFTLSEHEGSLKSLLSVMQSRLQW
ncbi:MAG: hypothetical protein H0V27_03780 [Pyrinomonadaceae bacterium]|nr:hypothetical protein [Pyrinomonadaceae bacterium]